MPSDEYASAAAGGALRLKGAKVEKHRKKHKHKHSKHKRDKDREDVFEHEAKKAATAKATDDAMEGDTDKDAKVEDPYAYMTEAERRFAEAQDKKIRDLMATDPEHARATYPELFKSHKERLADLNTYLSRMSEHHDMPKIGPG